MISALGVVAYLGVNLWPVGAPTELHAPAVTQAVAGASGGLAADETPLDHLEEAATKAQAAPEELGKAPVATFDAVKPWLAAGVSLVMLVLSLVVIMWKGRFSEQERRQAWTIIGSVAAFWSGVGAS